MLDAMKIICKTLDNKNIDYRITGVIAANLYGYGLGTNVIDIAVESDEAVIEAVNILGIQDNSLFDTFDPFIYYFSQGGYLRIQGDILGEPVIHPSGLKLQNKELLLDRLDIYANMKTGNRVEIPMAFTALTINEETAKKYKDTWLRL